MPGNKKPNRKPGVKKVNRSAQNQSESAGSPDHRHNDIAIAKNYGVQKESAVINNLGKPSGSARSR